MLSEMQAWRKLHRIFSKPDEEGAIELGEFNGSHWICFAIDEMRRCCQISIVVMYAMSDRMRRKGNMPRHVKNQWGLWWQLSKRGAASRARFCLKMADQCKSEKEAKKRVSRRKASV